MQSSPFLAFVLLIVQPRVAFGQECNQEDHSDCKTHFDGGATATGDDEMPVSSRSLLQKQLDSNTYHDTHAENNTQIGSWGSVIAPVLSCSLSSFDFDLGRIALAVYEPPGSPLAHVPGWELDLASAAQIPSGSGTDNVRIYKNYASCQDTSAFVCRSTVTSEQCTSSDAHRLCRRSCGHCQPTCALAFSGTNEFTDWVNNLHATDTHASQSCGTGGIHNGFWTETQTILTHSTWPVLASTMSSCAEKYVVGHSLGGAIASILAYCANKGALSPYGSSFPVNQLYSFGAPAVSAPALTSNGGSCFAGKRFYIVDSWTYDPVPAAASRVGYRHPKMQAEQISLTAVLSSTSSSCDSALSEVIPAGTLGLRGPSKPDHSMSKYVSRTQRLSCSP